MLRDDELIVDNFAGGGGASTGIEAALSALAPGRHVDIAINHDPEAVALHNANHPQTAHHCQSVWKADPRDVTGGKPVGLAWFSPDCKHFSKAKGGKPVEKRIRDLAWVVVLWAKLVRPRVIMLENVEEFRDWGPLIETDDGKLIPCPLRKGLTFKRWVRELKKLGYAVEHREMRACDYGAPTIRKRLFLIARCDGAPIVFPAPTHAKGGAGGLLPWRTAAECIDWSLPCPSIFDRKKPLAEATLRRIARGIQRYVIDAQKPFIVGLAHGTHAERPGARCHGLDEPIRTVHAGGGNHAVVEPFIVPITHHGDDRCHSGAEPMRTVTSAHRGELSMVAAHVTKFSENSTGTQPDEPLHTAMAGAPRHGLVAAHLTKFRSGATGSDMADPVPTVTANSFIKRPGGAPPMGVVAATMVQTGYGERDGQAPRTLDIEAPAGTAVAGGVKAAVVAAHLQRQFGNSIGSDAEEPAGTVTAGGGGKSALVAAFMAQHNTGVVGHGADEAVSTIVGKGCTQAVVAASLMVNTTGHPGSPADSPAPTVTTGGHHAIVAPHLQSMKGSARRDRAVDEPANTVCAGGTHAALVAAFMQKYYGTGGQDAAADDPMHTATAKARLGLVTIVIDGTTYVITDIGMRMLTPRELYRAQGFPDSYVIDPDFNGKPMTKTAQIRMCGNSVCPPMASALVQANLGDAAAAASEVA